MLAAKLESAHSAAVAAAAAEQDQLDRAKAAAEAEKQQEKQQEQLKEQQARADKKAQAEYDRLMKNTQGNALGRTTTSRSRAPEKSVLEQVLGSQVTKTILTGVVAGIFGTCRRR
jgi:uncharacterized protein